VARGEDVVAVSNLQKSQYGQQYYFNQAFWLRKLGDETFPKENKCHIRSRLGTLCPEEASHIEELLDLDYDMPEELRIEELLTLLDQRLLPLIEAGSSIAGLRRLFDQGALNGAAIRGPAQQALASAAQ